METSALPFRSVISRLQCQLIQETLATYVWNRYSNQVSSSLIPHGSEQETYQDYCYTDPDYDVDQSDKEDNANGW